MLFHVAIARHTIPYNNIIGRIMSDHRSEWCRLTCILLESSVRVGCSGWDLGSAAANFFRVLSVRVRHFVVYTFGFEFVACVAFWFRIGGHPKCTACVAYYMTSCSFTAILTLTLLPVKIPFGALARC